VYKRQQIVKGYLDVNIFTTSLFLSSWSKLSLNEDKNLEKCLYVRENFKYTGE